MADKQSDKSHASPDEVMKSFPPELQLSPPASLVARLLAPLLDALIFWRLRTMIWQQNQINFYTQAAILDLAGQQKHAQAAILDLAGQQQSDLQTLQALQAHLQRLQQYAQQAIADLAAQKQRDVQTLQALQAHLQRLQQYAQQAIADLAAQQQSDVQTLQISLDALRGQIADAEHLQTDLIAEVAGKT